MTKERVSVDLDRPLKEAGEYVVRIDFPKGAAANMKVRVKKAPR